MKSSNFNSIVLYDMTIKTIVVPNLHMKNKILALEDSEDKTMKVDILSYGFQKYQRLTRSGKKRLDQ